VDRAAERAAVRIVDRDFKFVLDSDMTVVMGTSLLKMCRTAL